MPFADPHKRRTYLRDYHAEFRLGLRRTETPAEVEAKMDQRREAREQYLRDWAAANRARRSAARKKQRQQERVRVLEGALSKIT